MNIKERMSEAWEAYQLTVFECLNGLTFEITTAHIRDGQRKEFGITPVQLSIKSVLRDEYGFEDVFCDLDYAHYFLLLKVRFPTQHGKIIPLLTSYSVDVVITRRLWRWLDAWRKGEPTQPITIRLQEYRDKDSVYLLEADIFNK